jgi:DNA-binding response OmpR family regulator
VIDPVQLELALLNLALNARDAMPEGGRLTIETGNVHLDETSSSGYDDIPPGDYVLICVSDTGTGMSPEVAARVFEPFFTTKEPGKGSGLGLSMVYGFVRQSGGYIKIYSEMGQGSSFNIYLPRSSGTTGTSETKSADDLGEPKGHETILVVEDETKIRDLLRSYLEREGFSVMTTDSGAEAIGLASHAAVDLVVLDLRLPDVPGEEVAREIRRFSRVPILMLTAKSAEADRILGLEVGADDYVTKPFSPREVTLRIRAILRRGRGDGDEQEARHSFGDGEVIIDESRREAVVRGEVVELTPTEWGVLLTLANVPGRVYSRYELINRVRGYEFDGYERTIDSHVKNLRRKIEREPGDPAIVVTVVGAGYRFALARDD